MRVFIGDINEYKRNGVAIGDDTFARTHISLEYLPTCGTDRKEMRAECATTTTVTPTIDCNRVCVCLCELSHEDRLCASQTGIVLALCPNAYVSDAILLFRLKLNNKLTASVSLSLSSLSTTIWMRASFSPPHPTAKLDVTFNILTNCYVCSPACTTAQTTAHRLTREQTHACMHTKTHTNDAIYPAQRNDFLSEIFAITHRTNVPRITPTHIHTFARTLRPQFVAIGEWIGLFFFSVIIMAIMMMINVASISMHMC